MSAATQRLAVASPVRSVPAPDTHDQAYAALDLHQGIGLGCEQWAFLPLCNPDQPYADWMRATVSPLDHDREISLSRTHRSPPPNRTVRHCIRAEEVANAS